VLRDIDVLKTSVKVEVGFSITTAEEEIRRIFEPGASSINEQVNALKSLHANGIKTFVMIAPLLPGAEKLPGKLAGAVDFVLVNRLNYHYADASTGNTTWGGRLRTGSLLKKAMS
jgi:DNA repair photolyase